MAFLDNLGDTIVDGTLTTVGRRRLAQAGGCLQIVKFAFGDDEINYELYDNNLTTAYESLTLLQTPIMEAFSNSKASIKYKLFRTMRQDLFYLPVLKINNGAGSARFGSGVSAKWIVLVDDTTVNAALPSQTQTSGLDAGILNGFSPAQCPNKIMLDQGIDNIAEITCPEELRETQYIIKVDERFAKLWTPTGEGGAAQTQGVNSAGQGAATTSFVDADNIATYVLTTRNTNYVSTDAAFLMNQGSQSQPTGKAIAGGFGSRLSFKLVTLMGLRTDYLWNVLGTTGTETIQGGLTSGEYKYIDSAIDIFGNTTGVSITLPIRYVKKI